MELINTTVFNTIIIIIGATIGSVKASFEFDSDKKCLARFLDILLGLFVGAVVAFHYSTEFTIWFSGLIALLAGASGALILEVILQMLPKIVRIIISKYINLHITKKD